MTIEYKIDCDLQWQHLKEMLLKDYRRFKPLIDGWEDLWRRMYCLVCTRCYGYYLPYTFMAPVCDMFNHNHDNDNGLFVINKECHLDPLSHKSYFRSNKYLNDVRILFKDDNPEESQKSKERTKVLTQGFVVTDEYWKQRREATLPGWKD